VEFKHRVIETNGIRMHVAEAGVGPLVVLCHGFPESWYSWRHQLAALAAAGYHAVAPDMRGYGQTDRPDAIDKYSMLHLVGDVVGLVDALGEPTAVIAGHDWGAPVAWHAALLRPDRFRAVIGLSVPFRSRGPTRPTTIMPQTPDAAFYMLYFQEPGVAEAELERDVPATIRKLFVANPDDALHVAAPGGPGMVRRGGGIFGPSPAPSALPAWLTEADVEHNVTEFRRTGFRGGLSWYRNLDRNWELLAAFAGAKIMVPALYITGDRDLVVRVPGVDKVVASLKDNLADLRKAIVLSGCGHWTQQERPAEVTAAMLEFLKTLDTRR
jgi:pimeloyl-ACP methyl ester carboxylesterase